MPIAVPVRDVRERPRGLATSLRAGLATSAAAADVPERVIAQQTGHKSMAVLRATSGADRCSARTRRRGSGCEAIARFEAASV